ncbi:hypothetical protein [Thermococcus henrietii]|uniref:hypothetical protein n=1 Tax=Thermococcus henrietii TaxID=2016361 RepID=UPI000C078CA7|nr:hypothetical protein [Thermococcus henrietii]
METKSQLAVAFLFVLMLPAIRLVHATPIGSLCGPHSVLAPTEYCTFYPFIKVGHNDAIIDLSWDALGPGMSGLPTPSMVGDYYFYFKDGRLYYLGNTTGAYELFYIFRDGRWYLSDGRVIYSEKPCIVGNVTIPEEIRKELCSCDNVSIKSKSYPVVLNGSTLKIIGVDFTYLIKVPPTGNLTLSLRLPENFSLELPPNVTLRAVFLGRGVLIYTRPGRYDTPLDWDEVRVLYYDGNRLEVLNFTRGFENRLPVCKSPTKGENGNKFLLIGVLLLGVGALKIREIRRR